MSDGMIPETPRQVLSRATAIKERSLNLSMIYDLSQVRQRLDRLKDFGGTDRRQAMAQIDGALASLKADNVYYSQTIEDTDVR